MSTNHDIARLIPDLLQVAGVQGAQSSLQNKLLGVIDAVLPKCDLVAARGLRDQHGAVLLLSIRRSSFSKLKALSKKWNPHRQEKPDHASPDQLVNELSKLLRGDMQPAIKPPPAVKVRESQKKSAGQGSR